MSVFSVFSVFSVWAYLSACCVEPRAALVPVSHGKHRNYRILLQDEGCLVAHVEYEVDDGEVGEEAVLVGEDLVIVKS